MSIKDVDKKLKTLENTVKERGNHFIGYPINTNYDYSKLTTFFKYSLNNVGDPFNFSNYQINTREFEKEVLEFFAKIYFKNINDHWGYVTSGGTEGNHYGLFLAREKYPNAVLYFSEDTHYSIVKIARLLNVKYKIIKSQENGEIDYQELDKNLNKTKPAIFCLNYGTTVKGAIDNYKKVVKICKDKNIKEYYLHYDAALFGLLTAFIEGAPKFKIRNQVGRVNSTAISGHKFIGSPIPCGVVLTNKKTVDLIAQKVEYLEILDTTIPGSRNGHTPLILWYAIKTKGAKIFKKESLDCLKNAKYLHKKLLLLGLESNLNPYSNTVYFTKPSQNLVHKWQLATSGKYAHIILMQHVNKKVINKFLKDLEKELNKLSKKNVGLKNKVALKNGK